MAFALILDITRGVSHGDRIIRSFTWKNVFATDLCGIRQNLGKHLAYSAWVESYKLFILHHLHMDKIIIRSSMHPLCGKENSCIHHKSMAECRVLSLHYQKGITKTHGVLWRTHSFMMNVDFYARIVKNIRCHM